MRYTIRPTPRDEVPETFLEVYGSTGCEEQAFPVLRKYSQVAYEFLLLRLQICLYRKYEVVVVD